MTPDQFRGLALAQPGVVEGSHRSHPDFRVGGKIFASLGYPTDRFAMVKVSLDRQQGLVSARPNVFKPSNGSWGRRGSTLIDLEQADEATALDAITSAWENACT